MANKRNVKKVEVIEDTIKLIKSSKKISIEDINKIGNIGEIRLRTYEMIRDKFLNLI